MNSRLLHAVRPGPAVTVQDLGRPGFLRYGVTEGGVIDRRAHRAGAALLDQDPGLASLEVALVGGIFRSGPVALSMAVTGASVPITIAGRSVPMATVFRLAANTEVEIGPTRDGTYAYVAVEGGFDVPSVLGSRSTHLRGGFGGLEGRAVAAGDDVPVGPAADAAHAGRSMPVVERATGPIRLVWAPHASHFVEEARQTLAEDAFLVTERRDRMGMTLEAIRPLESDRSLDLPSSPVVAGDLQVPGDGHPVALLADRQPTGGYPRIATIIAADRDRFAQLPAGSEVRFELVDQATATAAGAAYRAELGGLAAQVSEPAAADLLDVNLISGFTVGDEEAP